MEKSQILSIAKRYKQISLWLTAGLSLTVLLACRVSPSCGSILPQILNPLVVSVMFSLVASIAYGESWRAVALSSPANLAKFYLAASALKMMLAAVVFLVYALVSERSAILGFAAIFALFYVVLLVFDCVYFARIEKRTRI